MRAFSGSEPLVGEVFGLRTFRVDESGLLLPLFSDLAWYDGPNQATCVPPTGEPERTDHQVASPGCECGFYAFGDPVAAGRNRHSRYVLAVVACWGSVVAGTQGVRAERARIDAIWLGQAAPPWLRKRVALTYPSARIYQDRAAMLAQHPLTALPCYRPATRLSMPLRAASVLVGAALVALGVAPTSTVRGGLWDLWIALTALLAAVAVWLLVGARTTGHAAAAVVVAGCVAWVAAPLFGVFGWLLRLPVLRAALVAAGGYALALRPGYFPIEREPVAQRFRGVVA
jgi:hypothetical protein